MINESRLPVGHDLDESAEFGHVYVKMYNRTRCRESRLFSVASTIVLNPDESRTGRSGEMVLRSTIPHNELGRWFETLDYDVSINITLPSLDRL